MEDFEKRMKEYFRERELGVSEDAWSRMEALLDEAPEKKVRKERKYIWAIAASLILTIGLWTLFKKSMLVSPEELENKPAFVVSDTVKAKLKEHTESKAYVNSNKNSSGQRPALGDAPQSRNKKEEGQKQEKPVLSDLKELKDEEIAVTTRPAEHPVEPEAIASVHKEEQIRIYVNPNKLLRNAEIERQLDNAVTDGKSFWKKIKEINTVVVENSK